MEDIKRQLETALAAKQEAEAKATDYEEKLQRLQQPGTSNLNPNTIGAIAKVLFFSSYFTQIFHHLIFI